MLEKRGLVKLVEECGELVQIAAKKMARMDSDEHWDNNGSLKDRLENELADVLAIAAVVRKNFNLDVNKMNSRIDQKIELFIEWDNQENDMAIIG